MSAIGYELRLSLPREEDALGYKYDWTARADLKTVPFMNEQHMGECIREGVRKDLFGDVPEFSITVDNDDPATLKEAAAKLKKAASEWLDELKGAAVYSLDEKVKEPLGEGRLEKEASCGGGTMNLYMVEQHDNRDYDTYDSFVCAATSEEEARRMNPDKGVKVVDIDEYGEIHAYYDEERICADHSWAKNLKNIDVELIGVADRKYEKPTVILASFNAG